jgi:hypothetical protein
MIAHADGLFWVVGEKHSTDKHNVITGNPAADTIISGVRTVPSNRVRSLYH